MIKKDKGFTILELLIVMVVISILAGLSLFSVDNARESARDGRRKADLETIASGVELYKADCGVYPPSPLPNPLIGNGSSVSCAAANVYIQDVPQDPQGGAYTYRQLAAGARFDACATLEKPPPVPQTCGGAGNYRVTNP